MYTLNSYDVIQLGSVLGAIVVLVLILALAKGRSRLLGSLGTLLIIVNLIGSMVFSRVFAQLLSEVAPSNLSPLLIANSLLQTASYGAGVILLGLAVNSGHRIRRAPIS